MLFSKSVFVHYLLTKTKDKNIQINKYLKCHSVKLKDISIQDLGKWITKQFKCWKYSKIFALKKKQILYSANHYAYSMIKLKM